MKPFKIGIDVGIDTILHYIDIYSLVICGGCYIFVLCLFVEKLEMDAIEIIEMDEAERGIKFEGGG